MRHLVRATTRPGRLLISRPVTTRHSFARQSRFASGWSQSDHKQVRLRQPLVNWRKVSLWAFYSATSYFALQYLLGRLVDGLELDEEDTETAKEEAEGDDDEYETIVLSLDDEDESFIPIQTPKQLPRHNYKQSDPEWQAFIELSKDAERQKAARKELSEKLAKTAAALKPLRQKLGKDIQWTKSWLDFSFPDQAAPEYIRRGWVLTDEGAAWSKQIIPHSQYIQLRHILWPRALFHAGKLCLKTFYDLQAIKVKNSLGMELDQKEKQLQLASKVIVVQMKAKAKLEEIKEQMDQMKPIQKVDPETGQHIQKRDAEKLGPPESKEASASEQSLGKAWAPKIKISMPTLIMSTDFLIATRMFVGTLAHSWKQSKLDDMPPGACFLSGDVELVGSKGRCKMGVMAAYDPKQSSFVWINSKPKGFWNHSQVAKGGP